MKICISIVSWNYLSHLEEEVPDLVLGIDAEDIVQIFETGVKDNLFSYNHPQLYVNKNLENLGFASVHGIAVSKMVENAFDGLLILNPDIRMSISLVKRLKECIHETENKCVIGAPIYNRVNKELKLEYGGFPLTEQIKDELNLALYNDKTKEIHLANQSYSVQDVHGSFVYFPASIIKKYGWMDSSYFLYGEENEYLHRLNQEKVPIKIFTKLAILHENGGTFTLNEELKKVREYYKTRNRLYNNVLFFGKKAYLSVNYLFLFKYFVGRYLLRRKQFIDNDLNYYNFLGYIHFFKGVRGKTFDPNDYDDK